MRKRKITFNVKSLFLQAGILMAICLGSWTPSEAQSVDRIAGIVGDDIILHSEILAQIQYYKQNGMPDDGSMYCTVMEEKIFEHLLLNKARQDSIEVSDDEITGELERRMAYFIQGYGGVDQLEKIYGKPLIEIKDDLRDEVKDKLLVDRMRQSILSKVTVTPRDVKRFYSEIPKDSLPLLPAEVELYHIASMPKPSESSKQDAYKQLKEIRQKIVSDQETFGDMAKKYSRDPGSARTGGELGTFGRGQMVPEFEEIAFNINEGDVSEIFETDYGYHILQVSSKVGQTVTARHILITSFVTSDDDAKAMAKLNDVRGYITTGDTLEFETAATKYSDDQATATYGGNIKNPQSGEPRVPIDMLDADFFFLVDEMEEGEISEPSEWFTPDKKRGFHIVYLKRRVAPHVANLEDDYFKIQQAALQAEQGMALETWFRRAVTNIYIDIKSEECIGVLPYLLPSAQNK